MKSCAWLPDRIMLSMQYYILMHRWPDLKNPKRFTEWIQYYKMHYRNPNMLRCVDKYEVRSYVEEKGCGEYLNELYQICDDAAEIDFEKLSQKFVIKTTNGGNGDNVLVVKDKNSLDLNATIHKVNSWLKKNYSNTSREWAYSGASNNPRIIVEAFLENSDTNDGSLIDYKFFCFNGEPFICQVISERYSNEHIDFYNTQWKRLDGIVGLNPKATNSAEGFPKPKNLDKMLKVAQVLSQDFPFVRVDLYNVNGKIYFGELTFYPSSGYGFFNPDSFDFKLGELFKIAQIKPS